MIDQERSLYVFLNDKTHVFMNLNRSRKLIKIALQLRLSRDGTEQRLLQSLVFSLFFLLFSLYIGQDDAD